MQSKIKLMSNHSKKDTTMAANDEATAQNSEPLVNSLKDDVLGNDDAVGIAEKIRPAIWMRGQSP